MASYLASPLATSRLPSTKWVLLPLFFFIILSLVLSCSQNTVVSLANTDSFFRKDILAWALHLKSFNALTLKPFRWEAQGRIYTN